MTAPEPWYAPAPGSDVVHLTDREAEGLWGLCGAAVLATRSLVPPARRPDHSDPLCADCVAIWRYAAPGWSPNVPASL